MQCALIVALSFTVLSTVAEAATPSPTSAVLNLRVFNDCPFSTLTTSNAYPASIWIEDQNLSCGGFANLHNWRLSEDGSTAASFDNNAAYVLSFDMQITGTAEGEAGLSLAPWWSTNVDGRLNVRTTDGEIACFGGRLPFYSFTGSHGVTYTKGDWIYLEITYQPHANSMDEPAEITYVLDYNGTTYSSGPLPFDEGNAAEGYGSWGALDEAQAGGYMQAFLQAGNVDAGLKTEWANIRFQEITIIETDQSSWGKVKSMYSDK
jgi:hypothetical protein